MVTNSPLPGNYSLSEEIPTDSQNNNVIQPLEAMVRVFKSCYTWNIPNFSIRHETMIMGEYLNSSPFTSNDRHESQWYLKLYPRGNKENKRHHISIYLKLLSSNKSTTIMAKFNLSVLDAEGKKVCTKKFHPCLFNRRNSYSRGHGTFVRTDFLLNETNGILPNGRLAILCDLSVIDDRMIIKDSKCKRFHENLGRFLETNKFSDVTLVAAGGRKFEAHKIILAAHSSVFSAMFDHEMKIQMGNRLDMSDIDHDVLEEVLRFIYTESVNHLDTMAQRLLVAAIKYDIGGLKIVCEKSLGDSLNIENVVDIFILAELYGSYALKARAMDFIGTHGIEVF